MSTSTFDSIFNGTHGCVFIYFSPDITDTFKHSWLLLGLEKSVKNTKKFSSLMPHNVIVAIYN